MIKDGKRNTTVEIMIWLISIVITVMLIIGKIQGILQGEWFFIFLPTIFVAFAFLVTFIFRYGISKILK